MSVLLPVQENMTRQETAESNDIKVNTPCGCKVMFYERLGYELAHLYPCSIHNGKHSSLARDEIRSDAKLIRDKVLHDRTS